MEIEFVDHSFSGKYEIAPNPWFKDAFTYVQGAGLTLAESLGIARRIDRPEFRAGTLMDDSFARWGGVHSSRDNPFERMPPGLYRVDPVLKDVNSGAVGLAQQRLSVPAGQPEILGMSTLMLARDIRPVDPDSMERLAPFVLGNLKVIPNVTGEYRQQDKLKLMFQIYNAATEQLSSRPMVDLEYLIYAGDRLVKQTIDFNGGLTQSLRGLSTTVVKDLVLSDLAPGKYRLLVKGRDTLAGKEAEAQADFSVRPF